MKHPIDRRTFLNSLAVGAAAAATAVPATYFAGPRPAHAAFKPKGNIPDKPFKAGHITFLTGPANLLGEPGRKGHLLAAEEINAEGGFLGKRKIETIFADEAAGTDANVKELRRMKLSENIDLFTGIISSGNTPALGPVAEELGRADDVQRRLHRLPVRQGGDPAEVRLPGDQHPVGGRRHLRGRRGEGLAAGQAGRLDPAGLQLRPQRA